MARHIKQTPIFELGQIVATNGIAELVREDPNFNYYAYLLRHATGDWGDLDDEDKKSNDRAVRSDRRILSSYNIGNNKKFWIITEHDRSVTTFMLPEEY
jgi:hypothetical protein